jgi:hypothetical protein
VLKINSSC